MEQQQPPSPLPSSPPPHPPLHPPPHPLALPPELNLTPDSFDVLTDLLRTLEHLRAGLDASQPTTAPTTSTAPAPAPQRFISSKDVLAETDGLRHKMARARAQIRKLPDVGRTVAQQETDIRALEDKMARQLEVVELLRNSGGAGARGEM